MEHDELVYACAINRIFNYDCGTIRGLLGEIGAPSELFSFSKRELELIFGKRGKYAAMIGDKSFLAESEEDVKWCTENKVRMFYINDSDYPHRLRECNDAPILLYYKGTSDLNQSRIISVVGSRNATEYGKRVCDELLLECRGLDPPPLVVSGLAYGIDVAAHKGALKYGVETVGVMATGLDTIYPRMHREVAAQMVRKGGVLTDFPAGTIPYAVNFIRRNRIIAGLSDGVILVESREGGGGMITAKMAASYSREVFAFPGKISDNLSRGCNQLIKDNIAELVTEPSSIFDSLGWKNSGENGTDKLKFLIFEDDNETSKGILKLLLSKYPLDVDEMLDELKCGREDLLLSLTGLEVDGRVKRDLLGRFTIA